jgi:hypothetical protein
MELKDVPDVREHIKNKLALRKCLEISEDDFFNFGVRKPAKKA